MPKQNEFLWEEHPLYTERKATWERNERRLRGGMPMLNELRRFDWETGGALTAAEMTERARQAAVEESLMNGSLGVDNHYGARQAEAYYVNFPDAFASMLTGHIFQKAPEPDQGLNFGQLGKVTRATASSIPTQAELVYYNADGIGNNGSQWNNWWSMVGKWATATGHRWCAVEASDQAPTGRDDEMRGLRPFLVSYSPLAVPNWDDVAFRWFIMKIYYREPKVVDGKFSGNDVKEGRRIYVAEGCDDLGAAYNSGGWWEFDENGEIREGRHGDWSKTGGHVPMWPHFYERDPDKLSRDGIFELGQAAAAFMNLSSAADFDAWDAAQSVLYALGVDAAGFNLLVEKLKERSKVVPLVGPEGSTTPPQIADGSMGAVTAGVFKERLQAIRDVIKEIATLEVSGSIDSSGVAKQSGFADRKSPRLALIASEMENSQNTALHYLEKRYGHQKPSGSVRWPRDFELTPVLEQIDKFIEAMAKAEVESPTLLVRAVVSMAREVGFITDDAAETTVKEEILESLKERRDAAQARQSMMRDMIPGRSDPGDEVPVVA